MFSLENDSDVVVCPYNKAHRLLRKRLQSHLIKCRKNYPQLELQICPFNVTHHIPEPEFALHVTNCPDRKLITQYKYDTVVPKEEVHVRHAPVECDENWDDTEVEDYNPQKFIDKKSVLRKPFGVPPAERKQFIKSERKRLGDNDEYSESEEDEDAELEKFLEEAIKKEKSAVESEESSTSKPKRSISKSPSPEPAKRPKPKSKSRSRSPQAKGSIEKSRPRSRSPVNSAFYRRIHGRDSHSPEPPPAPRYKEPSFIREPSPKNTYKSASPTPYDIDDDPYYSGGSTSNRIDCQKSSSRGDQQINYPTDLYMPSPYVTPQLVAYPTRLPTRGRGAYRGYSHNPRDGYRNNGFP